jgi:hypothetical protein
MSTEGGFVWPGTVGADVGFFVGFFVGLCVGVIEGLAVGFLVGLLVGEAEGLAVGVVSTCANSIVTSISIEEAAAALKSSLLTVSLTISDTPVALEEISYVTSRIYEYPCSRLLCLLARTAMIWSRMTHLIDMPVTASYTLAQKLFCSSGFKSRGSVK